MIQVEMGREAEGFISYTEKIYTSYQKKNMTIFWTYLIIAEYPEMDYDMPYLIVKSSAALKFRWTGTRSTGFRKV